MIDTYVMQDASEILRYDQMGIPLYIQRDKLSDYPDWKVFEFLQAGGQPGPSKRYRRQHYSGCTCLWF